MTDVFSASDPAHQKALRMLETDLIAWFTTIADDGSPRSVPVWFWWQDGLAHVMSKSDSAKVAHVRRGSPVLLHLHAGGPFGDDVVILHGSATVSPLPTAESFPAPREDYVAKYGEAIKAFGAPLDEILRAFDAHVIFMPERVQAW